MSSFSHIPDMFNEAEPHRFDSATFFSVHSERKHKIQLLQQAMLAVSVYRAI
jgi:hypothetical protein